MYKAVVLTVSDSRTIEDDFSGQAAIEILKSVEFEVVSYSIVTDDVESIKERLKDVVDTLKVDLVVTSGGTGFGTRDVTPEATLAVVEKNVPGICELMRAEGAKHTKKAYLSRAVAGIRGSTLIINLPGSPKGVKESLNAIQDLLGHSVKMLRDKGH